MNDWTMNVIMSIYGVELMWTKVDFINVYYSLRNKYQAIASAIAKSIT